MKEVKSFPELLLQNYQNYGDEIALRQKDFGIWNSYTWKYSYEFTKHASLGLLSLGIKWGDKVGLVGRDEPSSFLLILATQAARAISVPTYPDSSVDDLSYVFGHSECRLAIAEDQEQVDKMLEISDRLPGLEKIIYWDNRGMNKYDDAILMSCDQLRELGKNYEQSHPGAFEDSIAQITSDDFAMLCYTSGTSARPKGVQATHGSLASCGQKFTRWFDMKPHDRFVPLVPSAHLFGQYFAGTHYLGRVVYNFVEEAETVMADLREMCSKFILMAPTQWQGLSSMIQTRMSEAGFLKRFSYNLLLPVGYKLADLRSANKNPNLLWRFLNLVGHWLVFRPIQDKLGLLGVEHTLAGGAFTGGDTIRFFNALNIPLKTGYGITECGMVTLPKADDFSFDTVGELIDGIEVRISDESEILVRGDTVFQGYYKDPETTKSVIRDGWFHTGDAGFLSPEGKLVFQERVKDLATLANGYGYAPTYIESKLSFSPYIANVITLGRNRDYISAIIVMDLLAVSAWAEKHRVNYTTFADLSQKDEIAALIGEEVEKLNRYLPQQMNLVKFALLHKELDADEAEMTRSGKVRRVGIEGLYKELVEAIYQDKDEVWVEAVVKYRDGRTGTISTPLKIRTVTQGI